MKAVLRPSSHLTHSNLSSITRARHIHTRFPTLKSQQITSVNPYHLNHYKHFSSSKDASYTMDQLKELRQISGAPLKECKKALENTADATEDQDRITEALDWLRIRGQSIAQQKSGDIAKYGFIAMFKDINTNTASLCEVNCVTDFVENNPIFQNAVMNIGNTIKNSDDISANNALSVEEISNLPVIEYESGDKVTQTIAESLTDIVSSIRENLVFRRAYKMECTQCGVICGYLHGRKTDNLGMKGSLVSLETDKEITEDDMALMQELGQNVATHIVANYPQPKYVTRDEMSGEQIEKEKELVLKTIMEKGGDAQDMEKVQKQIEGRMKKYFMENVLMEQPFCLEDDNKLTVEKLINKTAKQLNCNIKVGNMVVYNLGEGVVA